MWKNERRYELIRNIVIGLILIVVLAGLGITYRNIQQKILEEDQLLQEIQSSQREELSNARQENKEQIDQIYQQHLDVLAQYMPGVVCWGDSLTIGSSGNVSYPHTLQKYLDTYICDIYDIRYSLNTTEGLSTKDWDTYKVSIPVVNMGAGQENTATILGRSGVEPYVVSANFTIPAGTESVPVGISSPDRKTVTPLIGGDGGVNPVTIAGVQGTLTRNASTSQWSQYAYEFTRLEAGEEVSVEKDTEVITAATDAYKDYIHIVWLGTYGNFSNADKLVNETKALLKRQNINTDRYLVIGPCTYNGSWVVSPTSLDTIDSAMIQAFGDRYINLRKYLMADGLRDADLSATTQDKRSISNGYVPDSFRSSANGADLNGVAYELLGQLVYERMDRLGYLEEIREELKLEKIIQDILKEDPQYFENRLNAY